MSPPFDHFAGDDVAIVFLVFLSVRAIALSACSRSVELSDSRQGPFSTLLIASPILISKSESRIAPGCYRSTVISVNWQDHNANDSVRSVISIRLNPGFVELRNAPSPGDLHVPGKVHALSRANAPMMALAPSGKTTCTASPCFRESFSIGVPAMNVRRSPNRAPGTDLTALLAISPPRR